MGDDKLAELSEKTLAEWYKHSAHLRGDYVRQLIDALRTARQELISAKATIEVLSNSETAREKRIAELEQQLAAEHARAQSLQKSLLDEMCKSERDRERIAELTEALEGVVRVADRKTREFDIARAALAKEGK